MYTKVLQKRKNVWVVMFSFGLVFAGMASIAYVLETKNQAPEQSKAGAVPTEICAETILSDEFSGADYLENWEMWSSAKGSESVSQSMGVVNLKMNTLTGSTTGHSVGLANKTDLVGDFTLIVTSESIRQLEGKAQGIVSVFIGEATESGVNKRIEILRDAGSNKLKWQVNPSNTDWNGLVQGYTDELPKLKDDRDVVFKFARNGKDVRAYYNLIDGSGYKTLNTFRDFSDKDLAVALQVSVWAPDYPETTGVFDDLKVCKGALGADSPADLDSDGKVSIKDFGVFVKYYTSGDLKADFNADSKTNISDFTVFKNEYVRSN